MWFWYKEICIFHNFKKNRSSMTQDFCPAPLNFMFCPLSQKFALFSISTHWGRDKVAAIFPDDIFTCIFLNETLWISLKIALKFAPKIRINNIQIMLGADKPSSEPMVVSLLTHKCVTRSQWVKTWKSIFHRLKSGQFKVLCTGCGTHVWVVLTMSMSFQ